MKKKDIIQYLYDKGLNKDKNMAELINSIGGFADNDFTLQTMILEIGYRELAKKIKKDDRPVFLTAKDIISDRDNLLMVHYHIWNENKVDSIPYEGSLKYPEQKIDIINVVKIAAYCDLKCVFTSENEDIEYWANNYARQYHCSGIKKDRVKANDGE